MVIRCSPINALILGNVRYIFLLEFIFKNVYYNTEKTINSIKIEKKNVYRDGYNSIIFYRLRICNVVIIKVNNKEGQ